MIVLAGACSRRELPEESTDATSSLKTMTAACGPGAADGGLRRLLVAEAPTGYRVGGERALSEEEFLQIVGETSRSSFEEYFRRSGFVAAYERTWLPADGPHIGRENEDIIFGYAVCFPSEPQAQDYARAGVDGPVPNGTATTLPFPDGRFTVVRDGGAATALMRSDGTVVTFTQWSDVGLVDEEALRELAGRQASR